MSSTTLETLCFDGFLPNSIEFPVLNAISRSYSHYYRAGEAQNISDYALQVSGIDSKRIRNIILPWITRQFNKIRGPRRQ